MNTMTLFLVPLAVVAFLCLPFISVYKKITTGKQFKHRLICNVCMFVGVCAIGLILPLGGFLSATAAEAAGAAAIVGTTAQGIGFLSAAIAVGIACIGSGIAIAAAAPAALGAVSEKPETFGKAVIFVVLGEGIAIYGLLIAILIINKL